MPTNTLVLDRHGARQGFQNNPLTVTEPDGEPVVFPIHQVDGVLVRAEPWLSATPPRGCY